MEKVRFAGPAKALTLFFFPENIFFCTIRICNFFKSPRSERTVNKDHFYLYFLWKPGAFWQGFAGNHLKAGVRRTF